MYGPTGDETTVIAAAQIDEVCLVESFGRYEDFWFEIGSLWTAERIRIRHAVAAADPDAFALLYVYISHSVPWRQIAELPGAMVQDPRGSNGYVSVTVPVSQLTGYREDVTDLSEVLQK